MLTNPRTDRDVEICFVGSGNFGISVSHHVADHIILNVNVVQY